jgi:deferrochelatase/peroxidase EfeB
MKQARRSNKSSLVVEANRTTVRPRPAPAPTQFELPLEDVQAGIVRGFPNAACAAHLLVSFAKPDFGQRLIGAMHRARPNTERLPTTAKRYASHLERVRRTAETDRTNANDDGSDLTTIVTVGFTFPGLELLGVPFDVLSALPAAFREGMAARAETLGDIGTSAPATWALPWHEVHAIVMVHAQTEDALNDRVRAICAELGDLVVGTQRSDRLPGNTEPFGYRDGISNPVV